MFTFVGKPGQVFTFLMSFLGFSLTRTPLHISCARMGIASEQKKSPSPSCACRVCRASSIFVDDAKHLLNLALWWDASVPVHFNKVPREPSANPLPRHAFLWTNLVVVQQGSSRVWSYHMPMGEGKEVECTFIASAGDIWQGGPPTWFPAIQDTLACL